MTHRVIEHSRTLHYVFVKHSLLVLLFSSWFSWKWSRKPSFWEAHIPTFHVGSPSWLGCDAWAWTVTDQKKPNISRKASAKRVGRLSFFLGLFLGSHTCRSCSKAQRPPSPLLFGDDVLTFPFRMVMLLHLPTVSVVGSVTFPTTWIGF